MGLKYEKKNIYESLNKVEQESMFEYTDDYISFLDYAKTEYRCTEYFKMVLEEAGFKNLESLQGVLSEGDKVYYINKDRSIYAAVIGEERLSLGMNIIGAHNDSPRLDIKPMPMFEKQNMALLKTQYYGGVKKYQWLSIPLSMYGIVYNEKGEKVEIIIGDKKDDPCFTITDLLPHLSREQLELKANKFIDPENMSVIIGSIPNKDEKSEKVKHNILKILNKKYGINEIDFARSDIRFVPSFKSKYIGFDKGLIAGYGQDDRVCAYAAVKAIIDISEEKKVLKKTCVALIVDKEEIGSEGNTSMNSQAFEMFIANLLDNTEENSCNLAMYKTFNNSKMISADVANAVDPMYEEVSDIQNSNILGCGVAIEKYTGAGGKYSANDASAEYTSYIMNLFDKNNIIYQFGTLGKIEKGGGGTIAYILANKGMEVIDCGTSILSMHSPYELTSTADIYMTYKAYKSFYIG
ncbi:MAG: aminopeptidase [Clostridia bacterium]|nr:aminopeptidase [Clostridia bacterium]MDD4376187.1 aminopeptidase [Clostridia bacterium]